MHVDRVIVLCDILKEYCIQYKKQKSKHDVESIKRNYLELQIQVKNFIKNKRG